MLESKRDDFDESLEDIMESIESILNKEKDINEFCSNEETIRKK